MIKYQGRKKTVEIDLIKTGGNIFFRLCSKKFINFMKKKVFEKGEAPQHIDRRDIVIFSLY